MSLVINHAFTSVVSDEAGGNRVKPSHWNQAHILTGVTVTRISVDYGTVALTISHNLNDGDAELVGWSTTWNTNLEVTARNSNEIGVAFSTPASTGTLIAKVEVV